MFVIQIVALALLLAGNLLVLRWLVTNDPLDAQASESPGLTPSRSDPARLRRAA